MKIKTAVLSICITSFFGLYEALAKTESYVGRAERDGKAVYIERHVVEYDDKNRLLSAETIYERPDGSKIATLKSDFKSSLTVPNHIITDLRSGEVQGLRREDGKLVIFFQEKGKPEEKKLLSDKDAEDRIMVGCQGLNYYLLEKLDSIDSSLTLPLRFLIPGKLDYYDFDMKPVDESRPNIASFEIKVKSWFLKLFAPTLRVKYDKKLRHIVWYEGISNIKDDAGNNQTVTISYTYKTEQNK